MTYTVSDFHHQIGPVFMAVTVICCCEQDFDPMAEHRAPRVGDRDDEYKARRRNLIISPERHDPFAGEILFHVIHVLFSLRVSLCFSLCSVSWIFLVF